MLYKPSLVRQFRVRSYAKNNLLFVCCLLILQAELDVKSPRFSGSGWLAFPALRAAYKHVQLDLEFRPEAWDGILILAGERDDLQGDFMALILHHGFVEFRQDQSFIPSQ